MNRRLAWLTGFIALALLVPRLESQQGFWVRQAGTQLYRTTTGAGTSAITIRQDGAGNALAIQGSVGTNTFTVDGAGNTSIVALSTTGNGIAMTGVGSLFIGNNKLFTVVAPTVTTAGTSPAVASANGSATFRVNVGTGGTATTIVMAMPAAATGWNCTGSNITAAAANRNPTGVLLEQSSTTTAVTMQYQTVATGVALAFTASDVVLLNCSAF